MHEKVPCGSVVRVPERALGDDPYHYTKCLMDAMVSSYEVHIKNWYVWHILDKKKEKNCRRLNDVLEQ